MKLKRVSAVLMVMTMAAGCLSACGSSAEGNIKHPNQTMPKILPKKQSQSNM